MFDGLSFDKIVIIVIIAVIVLGPEKLPHYAAQLAKLIKSIRDLANGARERMRDEMGPEFDEVDWKKLDPRQYDPRRIIREALADDQPVPVVKPAMKSQAVQRNQAALSGLPVPYDTESTLGRPWGVDVT